MVWPEGSEAFDDVQRLAVEVPRPIEPMLAGRTLGREEDWRSESRHVDDKRVALPLPVWPPHPSIDGRLGGFTHVDLTTSVGVLIHNCQPFPAAAHVGEDLKWVRQIGSARHARKMTLQFRVE